jgi:hypothetical protein
VKQVALERTGWRDERISLRHRQWGFDCPAVDIDFLMVEYDHGRVCCLVEYKHEMAKRQCANHPSYRAIIDLANRAAIPFIACRYAADLSWWKAHPLNKYAKQHLPDSARLTEKGWVALLYQIRGRAMPSRLFNGALVLATHRSKTVRTPLRLHLDYVKD